MDARAQPESEVAQHYNQLKSTNIHQRKDSRIFHLRNFHNWIKSALIGDFIDEVRKGDRHRPVTVLDMCSGKGGDLRKWRIGQVQNVVCADIAATSVEQCQERYKEMMSNPRGPRMFEAEFHPADCSRVRLKTKYTDPDMRFDIASAQFAIHYAFESMEQADMMVRNACECLKPGGYFIGTMPNSNELVKRLRTSDSMSFGNAVYSCTFEGEDKQSLPLFGCKYMFHLEGVVDCPEYLVYIPLLQKLAAKYGMKLLFATPFSDFFREKTAKPQLKGLLQKMTALETFPPPNGKELSGSEPDAYKHAEEAMASAARHGDRDVSFGTLSKDEWEVTTVYLAFAFEKVRVDDRKRSRKEEEPSNTNNHDDHQSKRQRV